MNKKRTISPGKLRMAQVQRAIDKRWPGVEFVKGEGYFYLVGDAVDIAYATSMYVYSLNQLTLDEWMVRIEEIIKDAAKRAGKDVS